MKIILVLGLILGFSIDGFSQNKSIKDTICIDIMPEFIGGDSALNIFLSKPYPDNLLADGKSGNILVQFCINEDGTISEIKVVKGLNKLVDNWAIRFIKSMPN